MTQVIRRNFKSHLKEYFEDISQALFFRDARFGVALLALSLFIKSDIFAWGVLASVIGYLYSIQSLTPKVLRHTGLLTINGFFFGIAMAILFQPNLSFYITLVIGSVALPLLTKAAFEILQHWKLTPLIMPYIMAIWVLYLCGSTLSLVYDPRLFAFQPLKLPMGLENYLPIEPPFVWPADFAYSNSLSSILSSIFVNMGRIFFFQNFYFGVSLFALVTAFSPRRGFYFFMGTAVTTLVLFSLVPSSSFDIVADLGYCAGLVGLGLASMPEKFSASTILTFSVISLFVTLALAQVLAPFHLPLLSLPYVLTFWLALLSRVPKVNVVWERARVS